MLSCKACQRNLFSRTCRCSAKSFPYTPCPPYVARFPDFLVTPTKTKNYLGWWFFNFVSPLVSYTPMPEINGRRNLDRKYEKSESGDAGISIFHPFPLPPYICNVYSFLHAPSSSSSLYFNPLRPTSFTHVLRGSFLILRCQSPQQFNI